MNYREDKIYKTLERIITDAGVTIKYKEIPVSAHAHARAQLDGLIIEMPEDTEHFGDDMYYACYVLGHEIGHLLIDLDQHYYKPHHYMIESMCDFIGSILTVLAEMTAGTEAEREALKQMGKDWT